MTYDLEHGDNLLREGIRAAAHDLANLLIPGSALGVFFIEHGGWSFCRAVYNWLHSRNPAQQQQAINELTKLPVDRVRTTVEAELAAYALTPDTKRDLVNYLSAIPMTARRAISRPDDGGMPTTLLSQLPRTFLDLLPFVPLRPPRFQPGNQVPGYDYRLECLLGQGGFAEVWKAQHIVRELQPPVALKFCLDPALLVSLKREIEVVDVLRNANAREDFVRLWSTAYSADPPFLVYEYVDGGDLTAWLASFGGQPPAIRDVMRILRMTARAVAFAHQHGVIHRDLKPANLLVTREGRMKVADFGIGAIMAHAEAQSERGKSLPGATLLRGACTPLYADPRLSPGGTPDPRVDVYALGVIAYQLFIGNVRQPIDLGWRADLEQRQIPAAILDVIEACVAPPPRRLVDAGALLAMLDALDREGSKNARRERQSALHPRQRSASREPAAANYCIQCGQHVQSDDRFCIQCGYSLR
jgi:serine/threonine protein kinase